MKVSMTFALVCLMAGAANAALVHHYSLDDTNPGLALDTGSAAVPGPAPAGTFGLFTVAGGDARVPGILGNAVQTDDEGGSGGHFNMTLSGLDGATAGTWSLWFNLDTGEVNNNSTYNALFMTRDTTFDNGAGPVAGRNMGLALRNNSVPHRLDGRINGRGTGNSTDIQSNSWNHVALTWDGATGTYATYLNGALENLTVDPLTVGSIVTGGEFNLADDPCCGSREISGTMDDVAVWNETLSPQQIAYLYYGGLAGEDASSALAAMIIPEPTSCVLGAFGLIGLIGSRRFR